MYLTIKSIHIILVLSSISVFIIRGLLMVLKRNLYKHQAFKIIPPVIDSLLLISGMSLMIILQQYPTNQPWLAVKLSALILYIIFGTFALNRSKDYKNQVISFLIATLIVLFMFSVAKTHHPLGLFYLFV